MKWKPIIGFSLLSSLLLLSNEFSIVCKTSQTAVSELGIH